MKNLFFTLLFSSFSIVCLAQDDSTVVDKPELFLVNGYVKNLNGLMLYENDESQQWGLLHNRVNMKYLPTSWLTGALEVRNRLVYGEAVKAGSYTPQFLDKDYGLADLTFLPFDTKSAILSTSVERLWARAEWGRFEVTAGRQRINWGMNLVWNPVDMFNTYSFVDFDYEERPGSDAILARMNTGELSSIELAVKPGKLKGDDVYAVRYKFNKSAYDVQLVAGRYENDWVGGTAWAGSIGEIGFKGELSCFLSDETEEKSVLATATEFDYTFNGKVYANASYLYNSKGTETIMPGTVDLFNTSNLLTPKNLSPAKHSAFLQLRSISSPVFAASVSAIYFFGIDGLYVFPSLTYSINDNWEAAIFVQSFWLREQNFTNKLTNAMLRMKYSF